MKLKVPIVPAPARRDYLHSRSSTPLRGHHAGGTAKAAFNFITSLEQKTPASLRGVR